MSLEQRLANAEAMVVELKKEIAKSLPRPQLNDVDFTVSKPEEENIWETHLLTSEEPRKTGSMPIKRN